VAGADWQLRLLPRDRAVRGAGVRALLAEHSVAVVNGQRWQHEVVYWLRHEAHTDLNVTWPAPADVVGVAVDGNEVTPLQPTPDRLWLPLPGRAGARRVRLRWTYRGGETLERPNLDRPKLEGAKDGPTVWTAYVPLGWRAMADGDRPWVGGRERWASLDLARARALLAVSRDLAERLREAPHLEWALRLADVQKRFYQDCRRVEQALEMGPGGLEGVGEQLHRLREENRKLAQIHRFEPVREDAEKEARAGKVSAPALPGDDDGRLSGLGRGRAVGGEPAGRGVPLSWQGRADEGPPGLRLAPAEERRAGVALVLSGQWLGLLALVWMVSLSAALCNGLRWLWPEQMLLLGVFGWQLAGPTAVTLFLVALGVSGRMLLLGQLVRRLVHRPAPTTRPAVPGSTTSAR
jgi:hypothetical protein